MVKIVSWLRLYHGYWCIKGYLRRLDGVGEGDEGQRQVGEPVLVQINL